MQTIGSLQSPRSARGVERQLEVNVIGQLAVTQAFLQQIRKATGRPRSSVSAWILLVRPPRERPIACSKSPLLRPPPSDGL